MRILLKLLGVAMVIGLSACASSTGNFTASERADDLKFLPKSPEKGLIFAVYNYHGLAVRRPNWTSRFDLSGITWDDPRTATAISRNHVVMAAHYPRPLYTPLIFHDTSGMKHTRKLIRVIELKGLADVAVGQLDQPLPAGVKHYRLANPEDAVPMRLAFVTDQKMTLSLHRIGGLQGKRVVLGYDPKIPRTYWRNLVKGDSGNPAFVESGGELRLLTTFTTGGPGTGPFYGDPEISQAVQAAMERLR
jgi:hypothetical protein